jgi:hypothetical protein
MNTLLKFHRNYFETVELYKDYKSYTCSRKQARRIFGVGLRVYTQDTKFAGSDIMPYPIVFYASGRVRVGCRTFSKETVDEVRRWLK